MIGLDENTLFSIIDQGTANTNNYAARGVQNQGGLEPRDVLSRIMAGVAKAIAENNKAIEQQLNK